MLEWRSDTATVRPGRTETVEEVARRDGIVVIPDVATISATAGRSWYSVWGKRSIDLALAGVLCLALAPLMAVLWVILRIDLGPGVILRQERIGRGGVAYTCLKFRTMLPDRRVARLDFVGVDRRISHKSSTDPRHTRVGRALRKYSLDELPQLWNVVRGDMSLVGPRPEMASQADAYFIGHVRHAVRPGLTGPYQLSSHRGAGDLTRGLALDADYVTTMSFTGDLRLVARTLGAVVHGTGT